MVNGRKTQVWNTDAESVEKALKNRRLKKDQIFPPKLISPAQMQKLEDLSDRQKQQLTEELVAEKYGEKKLKKVERVTQETTFTAPISFF